MTEKTYTVEFTKAELKAIRRAVIMVGSDKGGDLYDQVYDKVEPLIQQAIADTIKGVN